MLTNQVSIDQVISANERDIHSNPQLEIACDDNVLFFKKKACVLSFSSIQRGAFNSVSLVVAVVRACVFR